MMAFEGEENEPGILSRPGKGISMNVNVIGLGYVGCVSAACLANSGHSVTGIDINEAKIDLIRQGKSPIIEPRLPDLLQEGIVSGRIKVTRDNFPDADVSIVC